MYNVTVQGSSNCDWGTDIGQSRKHTFTLEGFPEFINAMAYYKIEDVEKIEKKMTARKGRSALTPDTAHIYIKQIDGTEKILGVLTHNHIKHFAPMYDAVYYR